MTRAILVNFHKYTPFGGEYYEPLLDFFLASMKKYEDEYDHLYLLDSNWEIDPKKIEGMKASIIRTNPSMRYYDCFKEVLPQVKEDLVLFMDNDMVVYKPRQIGYTFKLLVDIDVIEKKDGKIREYRPDVVSIYDTCGEYKTDKLHGENKFCPYWFATEKDFLILYKDIDWGPNMPHSETLGLLTEAMLNDGVNPDEWAEDKSSILFDGTEQYPEQHVEGGRGYYHIRAGSSPAYLLATKEYGDIDTYNDYLKNQPKSELLRHCMWFWWMTTETENIEVGRKIIEILKDLEITPEQWTEYTKRFEEYHGLN